MKISTVMMVLTVAVALVATGCRYDKPRSRSGNGAGSGDATLEQTNIGTEANDIEATDDVQSGSIGDASTIGKNFEDYCTPCTDVAFAPVYFGFDSTVIPQNELGKIEAVSSHLAANPNRVVVVEGHCDDRGSNEYNLSLGENRAMIVRNYLINNGVAADRIQTRSYGEERPAVLGEVESAWSKNRRGEFVIFLKK